MCVTWPNTEGEPPCGDTIPTDAGFPVEMITVVQWFQWVHTLFRWARLLCQEKCLVDNKHQTRACKCRPPPERCLQRSCFGRSPHFVGGTQAQRHPTCLQERLSF